MSTTTVMVTRKTVATRPDKSGEPDTGVDRSGCPCPGKHGTVHAATKRRCICPDAVEAARIYRKRGRQGRLVPAFVSALGTQRRLRALNADGYPLLQIAAELGVTKQRVTQLLSAHDDGLQVMRQTAQAVAVLYHRLSRTPGSSKRAADRAARLGWPRSEHWIPSEIDDPAARSDLDYQRDTTPGRLLYEDIVWLEQNWPLTGHTGEERRLQAASRDQRIAADLTRQLGWTVTVDAVQTCRRRGQQSATSVRSKLTDDQIRACRDRFVREVRTGQLTRAELAAAFGISTSLLTQILSGKRRPHLALPDLLGNSPYRRLKGPRRPATPVLDRKAS